MQAYQDPAFKAEAEALGTHRSRSPGRPTRRAARRPSRARPAPATRTPTTNSRSTGSRPRRASSAHRPHGASRETRSRVLLVNGSPRNDGTCPGEMSKTLPAGAAGARGARARERSSADVLDLSLLTSEYGRQIHPCKGCVSTAMPLCHWPCSCYPNHSLRQTGDWMNEIYERWVAAHGVILFTPTHWYQATSPLKLMIDRLVCADGGNPDPTSTHGKKADEAKAIELKGWDYPKHLAGRAYGVVVHGDVAGIESLRRNLSDWLDWMGLDRRRRAGAAGPLHRLLRALRHQPRRARRGHGRAGRSAQRRACGRPGGGALARRPARRRPMPASSARGRNSGRRARRYASKFFFTQAQRRAHGRDTERFDTPLTCCPSAAGFFERKHSHDLVSPQSSPGRPARLGHLRLVGAFAQAPSRCADAAGRGGTGRRVQARREARRVDRPSAWSACRPIAPSAWPR